MWSISPAGSARSGGSATSSAHPRARDTQSLRKPEGEAVHGVAALEGVGERAPGHESRDVVPAQVERAPQGRVGGGAAPAPAHERGRRRQVLEVEAREHVHQAVRLHVRPRRRAGALDGRRRRRLHGSSGRGGSRLEWTEQIRLCKWWSVGLDSLLSRRQPAFIKQPVVAVLLLSGLAHVLRHASRVASHSLSCALFSLPLSSKFFRSLSITSFFNRLHEILNVSKKITNYTV
jgi:hypothetical protein